MRPDLPRPTHRMRPWLAPAFATVLWSCAAAPPQPEPAPPLTESGAVQPPTVQLELPPSPHRARFNDVESALAGSDWMRASVELDAITAGPLSDEDAAYARYLEARIAWVRGAADRAETLLEEAQQPGNSGALDYRIATFRHYLLAAGGDHLEAARLATQLLAVAPPERAAGWRRSAWRNLQRARAQELADALEIAVDPEWIGWLQLALDCRDVEPRELPAALERWLALNPEHPAAAPLPGGMGQLLQSPRAAPKAALLLPLSGRLAPAGRAVLDGFLAAHYQGGAEPGGPELVVLDTDAYPSATAAYDAAVRQGAGVVVGPLNKEAVADLGLSLQRPVPVVALNRVDDPLPTAGSALVQFALAPEDELATLAEAAYGTGARAALVLSPTGSWGEKMERTLREHWAHLGGTVVSAANYTDHEDHSRAVREALGLAASEERARAVRDMLATNIEFTPRRRGDPEVVFLLARDGAEARSIKPLLAFHYAGTVPVYAPSGIYNGTPDDRDRDLNGIRLVEMPWLLGESPSLRVAIAAGDSGGDNYTRFNALGADAHLLQAQLTRLESGADALFRGSTGLLSMDPQLIIRREPFLATFDGGEIRAE